MKIDEFKAKYRIDDETFEKAKITWEHLFEIKKDYESKIRDYQDTSEIIANYLHRCFSVHSVRMRVKDPEHLIEKIIRKRSTDQSRNITIDNYEIEITDLIGLRAIHLFKDQWHDIHSYILSKWDLFEDPKVYYREGDNCDEYKSFELETKKHNDGYRSIHYVVKAQIFNKLYLPEIQVRTIFEEGWCEIDHHIRYPYYTDNPIINQFLLVFNRLAGNADEMGLFVKNLIDSIKTAEKEKIEYEKRHYEEVEELINELDESDQIKSKLLSTIEQLKAPSVLDVVGKFLGNIAGGAFEIMGEMHKIRFEQIEKERKQLEESTLSTNEEVIDIDVTEEGCKNQEMMGEE